MREGSVRTTEPPDLWPAKEGGAPHQPNASDPGCLRGTVVDPERDNDNQSYHCGE